MGCYVIPEVKTMLFSLILTAAAVIVLACVGVVAFLDVALHGPEYSAVPAKSGCRRPAPIGNCSTGAPERRRGWHVAGSLGDVRWVVCDRRWTIRMMGRQRNMSATNL